MSVVQKTMPIGGADGFVFGSTPYALKCSGSPPSGENATAAGNTCFSSASGFGFVMMRWATTMVVPTETTATAQASVFGGAMRAKAAIIPAALGAVKARPAALTDNRRSR